MIYTHIVAALISAAIAATGAWKVQSWRYGEQIAHMKQEASDATTKAVKSAMAKTEVDQKRKDDALIEANKRAQQNAVAVASANRTVVSLRDQLAASRSDLSKATLDAARNYAAALSDVFGSCVQEYRDLAEKATSHASDSLMYQKAWPLP